MSFIFIVPDVGLSINEDAGLTTITDSMLKSVQVSGPDGSQAPSQAAPEDIVFTITSVTNLNGTFSETSISKLYFSQENLDYLQSEIINRVYTKTNKKHQVGRQSDDELLIVMRSIYLQYGKNNNSNLDKQINNLNELVLDYCVDNVYTNLLQYYNYIDDITKDQPVLDRPETTNIKGDKSLMPNHFF